MGICVSAACCATTACCSALCCCCRGCCGTPRKVYARIAYIFFDLFWVVIAMMFMFW